MTTDATAHLNFMKKQQWNVAYYAILLLAGVFVVKKEFVAPPLHFNLLKCLPRLTQEDLQKHCLGDGAFRPRGTFVGPSAHQNPTA